MMILRKIADKIFGVYFDDPSYNYTQVIVMFWVWMILISATFFLVCSLLLKLLHFFVGMKWLAPKNKISIADADENATLLEEKEKKKKKWIVYLHNTVNIFFYLTLLTGIFGVVMSIVPFSAFGEISAFWTILISLVIYSGSILLWLILAIPSKKDKVEDDQETISFTHKAKLTFKMRPCLMGTMVVGTLFLSLFWPLVTRGACETFFNDDYGFSFGKHTGISTKFTRKFWITDPVCPAGKPCHVYATVPDDPTTQVFLNVHTSYDVDNITLNYGT